MPTPSGPVVSVRYVSPGPAAFTAMSTGPEIRGALGDLGERGKAIAESISPRRTGHYSTQFQVKQSTVLLNRIERGCVNLVNNADYAVPIENLHHVLSRTRDLLGRV